MTHQECGTRLVAAAREDEMQLVRVAELMAVKHDLFITRSLSNRRTQIFVSRATYRGFGRTV